MILCLAAVGSRWTCRFFLPPPHPFFPPALFSGTYIYISSDSVYEVSRPSTSKSFRKGVTRSVEADAGRPASDELRRKLRRHDRYGATNPFPSPVPTVIFTRLMADSSSKRLA